MKRKMRSGYAPQIVHFIGLLTLVGCTTVFSALSNAEPETAQAASVTQLASGKSPQEKESDAEKLLQANTEISSLKKTIDSEIASIKTILKSLERSREQWPDDRKYYDREIAKLNGELKRWLSIDRRIFVGSKSTRTDVADYLNQFCDKVESLANTKYRNYLIQTFRDKKVMMTILINSDGNFLGSEVNQSSGNKKIDSTILAMLRDAFPMNPLPDTFRQEYDSLSFTKTWHFVRTPKEKDTPAVCVQVTSN